MKKIFTVITLVIIFTLLPSGSNAQELGKFVPQLTISNVTSVSFTVSWYSDGKADEAVLVGTQEPLNKWAVDDRGIGVERASHHVTVRGLSPDTEYFFRINNLGNTYKVKTAKRLSGIAPLPEVFQGTVLNEDLSAPEEGIVYMKIEGSQLLSTPTKADGSYKLRTVNIRNADLTADFRLLETNFVTLFARAGYEGEATKRVFAYARKNPIPLSLIEMRIPFFKIKFPDEIFNPAQDVETNPTPAPTVDPSTGVAPAGDEGFFGIVWKRVRDLF